MEFSTFLIYWFSCGFIAAMILALSEYIEARDDGKKEFVLTLSQIGIGFICMLFGIVSLVIMIIGFTCTFSEKPIFKMKINNKKENE